MRFHILYKFVIKCDKHQKEGEEKSDIKYFNNFIGLLY